jgi:hypothetical protein
VREAELVAGTACGDHRVRGAAGALGVRAFRVEPEPERHANRLGTRGEECDGAVDAAAHRHRDAALGPRGVNRRADRVRERVHRERLSRHGGRLEEREPDERTRDARRVGRDDHIVLNGEPDERPVPASRRVSDELDHQITVAASPPAHEPLENPANQVGALSAPDASRDRNRTSAPLLRVLVQQSDPQAGAKPDDCS